MLQQIPFQPCRPPTNEAARAYTPSFIYHDPSEPADVEIKEEFYGSRRKLRIGVLGAGIAAIQFLHSLKSNIPPESVEVVVDVPGPIFQFDWRPNIWSEWLPPASETFEYLRTVAKENDFYRHMHFGCEVVRASWTHENAKWTLEVKDLATGATHEDRADIFLELNGPVSGNQITIKGSENFKGQVVHTGEWNDRIDIRDKRIALIGYGSTGVQIAPELVKEASSLHTFFRHRTYIVPPLLPEWAAAGGANFRYTEEQKELLADSDVYVAYRKALDSMLNARFPAMVNGHKFGQLGREMTLANMKEQLAPKPGLFDKLQPRDFDVGCMLVRALSSAAALLVAQPILANHVFT